MATKKRMKRYDEGGGVEVPEKGTGAKRESFGDAFKRNRASGEKTFEFQGKKYTTETASKSGATAMRPSDEEISNVKMRQAGATPMRPSDEEISSIKAKQAGRVPAASAAEMAARPARERAQALEGSHPEDLLGGIGLKAAARGAKALAQAGERKAAQRATESLAAANRREALKESASRGTRAATREAEDAADMARMGSDYMKKGGKVKARSASQRADGCACRGKTRA